MTGERVTVSPIQHTVTVSAPGSVTVSRPLAATVTVTSPGPQGASSVANAFDVTDVAYGAVGDGTTDDTEAIQAAIDAATAAYVSAGTRQTVLVPPDAVCRLYEQGVAVYDANSGSNNPMRFALRIKSGVHLVIDGELLFPFEGAEEWGNWTIAVGATPADTDWKISGSGRINGGVTAFGTEWIHQGIDAFGSSGFEIDGIEVVGFRGDHIRIDPGRQTDGGAIVTPHTFRITTCHIHGGTGQAIETNEAAEFLIAGNRVHDNSNFAGGGGAEAIWVQNCTDFVISDNQCDRYGSTISIAASPSTYCRRGIVSGNRGDDEINWGAELEDITITGNHALKIRGVGDGPETRVAIVANTFTETVLSIACGTHTSSDLAVADNICVGSLQLVSAAKAAVTGNSVGGALDVRADTAVVTGNRAERATADGDDAVWSGNVIDGSTVSALTVSGARCLITGNYIKTTAAGEHAIKGTTGATVDNTVITGNMLYSATGNAIRMDGVASKVGTEQTNNKLLSGSVVGL